MFATVAAGKHVPPPPVLWDAPSGDYRGSMPLGNGDIGLNAWVDDRGDVVFYIGKTDAWGDNGRLLKVGRVRVACDPPIDPAAADFSQELDVETGTIRIRLALADRRLAWQLWVDANHPVIHVTLDSADTVTTTATIEPWRTARTTLPSIEVSDVMLDRSKPDTMHAPTVVEPDSLLAEGHGQIGWYHHNGKSVGPQLTATIQGLPYDPTTDPLLHRTFGAIVTAVAGMRIDPRTLRTPPGRSHRLNIYVRTEQQATPAQWIAGTRAVIRRVEQIPFDQRRREHRRWWKAFWQRSWIDLTGRAGAKAAGQGGEKEAGNDAAIVARGYRLQRFITACAGRGAYPIKFNGSIFTVPSPDRPGDADYRRWGPGYWWQNTRLPYMSLCASGDVDCMKPLFRMYGGPVLQTSMARTRRYFHHAGAFFPECIYFWGAVFSDTYGWQPVDQRADPLQQSGWHKWEWVSGLELAWLMLDYYDYTLDAKFLSGQALPTAEQVLLFFDRHYRPDSHGKLVLHPAQAAETWWDCTNPMPELAGLHAVTERLLRLPAGLTGSSERAFWKALKKKLPALPLREVDGVRMLAPAERFAIKHNIENPELYAVFPFRLVAFEKPTAPLGIAALKHRWDRGNIGWRQDDVFMAYLGLAEQARDYVVGRAGKKDPNSRFPAFWGPNYDWVPDQDHGSILMKAVQAMLLQTEGRKIYLLPALPHDWDVDFKLHAPYRTTVACTVEGGRIVRLKVTPPERADDVTVVGGRSE